MLVWAESLKLNPPVRIPLAEADPTAIKDRLASRSSLLPFKRTFDVVIVLLALPGVVPTLLIAAILVLITMGRPIFFVQDRIGRDGRKFRLIKLRTMRPQTDNLPRATSAGDPRVTPFGQFLRRSHLDELPQLWAILKGDMTLIGPRPEQPTLVESYRLAIPNYELRHLVTPGLSGWSQVCYGYACTLQETRDKLEFDLFYLQNFGLLMDLRILAKTFQVYLNPRYVR